VQTDLPPAGVSAARHCLDQRSDSEEDELVRSV
jgi:hypothetical protein